MGVSFKKELVVDRVQVYSSNQEEVKAKFQVTIHTGCNPNNKWQKSIGLYLFYFYGILLPKLFWPTARKNCSSDREKLLKFKAEDQDLQNFWDH